MSCKCVDFILSRIKQEGAQDLLQEGAKLMVRAASTKLGYKADNKENERMGESEDSQDNLK